MVILFVIGGVTFAIAANAVDEIRELADIQALPSPIPHQKLAKVRHTLWRQGRRYFVVDGGAHFQMPSTQPTRLMVMRHSPAAVIVDGIDRMQEIQLIQALPEAFSGEELRWYRGLTLIKGRVIPVVHAEAFLTKAEATFLNASMRADEIAERMAVTA
jgi:chemotaxis signal transduction protein